MTEFKQIIGRGTRVRDDYGKYYFNILDYTGSATRHFADPEFDGFPAFATEQEIDESGEITKEQIIEQEEPIEEESEIVVEEGSPEILDTPEATRRKYYIDGGQVEIVAHLVYELDSEGNKLRVVRYTDYTAENVRTLYPSAAELRSKWADAAERSQIIATLEDRGIDFVQLAEAAKQPDADPFDLLCHIAYNAPLRTRRERAATVKKEKKDFFERYGAQARTILDELLEKYAEHGVAQFAIPEILKVPPISSHGNVTEIAAMFGGTEELRKAVAELQTQLYAA
jgi:type I restriction enzyme R subunit